MSHMTCFNMIGQHMFVSPEDWDQNKVFRDIKAWINKGLGLPDNEVTFHEDAWAGGGNLGCPTQVPFAMNLLRGMGSQYFYSALAQELTGRYWVDGKTFGNQNLHSTPHLEETDMLLTVGWNPMMSHHTPQARRVLKKFGKDPDKILVVVDPRLSETAKIAFLFTKVGLSGADMGAAWLLPRIVGLAHATHLLMTGDFIDAVEAHRIGLYHQVVAPADVVPEARALAEKLAKGPSFALEVTKDALNREAIGDTLPDLTFFLDLDPERGLERGPRLRPGGDSGGDRIEREALEFHQRVREGYRTWASRFPDRIRILDAARSPDEVADSAIAAVLDLLRTKRVEG